MNEQSELIRRMEDRVEQDMRFLSWLKKKAPKTYETWRNNYEREKAEASGSGERK